MKKIDIIKKRYIKSLNEFLNQENQEKNKSPLNQNFWKWFGNSKVVDKQSNPLILYHGSHSSFYRFKIDPFKLSKRGNTEGVGIYFTKNKNLAKHYGSKLYEVYLRIEKPIYGIDYEFTDDELEVLGYYKKPIIRYEDTIYGKAITIRRNKYLPKEMDLDTINQNADPEKYVVHSRRSKITYKTLIGEFAHFYPRINVYDILFKKLGYDGYIGSEWTGMTEDVYVIFTPFQVKSIYNDGTWNISDTNIYS